MDVEQQKIEDDFKIGLLPDEAIGGVVIKSLKSLFGLGDTLRDMQRKLQEQERKDAMEMQKGKYGDGFCDPGERPPPTNIKSEADCATPLAPMPVAINTPLDRAYYLRPLQQPKFDTEVYPETGCELLTFFVRSLDKEFYYSKEKKNYRDTNMTKCGELEYPQEFSILGFNVSFDPACNREDAEKLMRDGSFQFYFSGNREYLNIPLSLLPGVHRDDVLRRNQETAYYQNEIERIIKTLAPTANKDAGDKARLEVEFLISKVRCSGPDHLPYHKFNIGRSALKWKSGEKISCALHFPSAPKISKPVRITAAMIGLLWMPF